MPNISVITTRTHPGKQTNKIEAHQDLNFDVLKLILNQMYGLGVLFI